MKKNHLYRLVLLALLGTPATAAAQDMSVQLLFDGQPLQSTATPDFTCLDRGPHVWFPCHITADPGADGYVMVRPAPGSYTLHVEIDDNSTNPARFPGDYDVFFPFTVTVDAPAALRVEVPKLMHVTLPWDNDKDLDEMLTRPWSEKPAIETSPGPGAPTVAVTFTWDAVVPGAEYTYVVVNTRQSPFQSGPNIVEGRTRNTSVTLRLPRSADGRYFQFGVTAHKGGRQVGDFITHDAGVQGWKYEFVVRNRSDSPTATAPAQTSRRKLDTERPGGNGAFLAEWQEAIAQPVWWDSLPRSPLVIRSFGDLMAIWQSHTNDEPARRRFYKLVYQAILDHPGDEDLVAVGIHLMSFAADSGGRFPLLKFGVDHFFSYNQRTDNCVHCKVGDTTGEMVRDLAGEYIARGEPEAAIEIIQRLVDERESDVSDYNLALTFETMAEAYWKLKDVDGAKAAIQEGLRRYPSGWQADQLHRDLDRYEQGSATAVEPR